MPLRSPPDRLKVEAALTADELAILRHMAAVMGVSSDCWHLVPDLGSVFGTYAGARIAAEFHKAGMTKERALIAAAPRVGLKFDTLRSRLKRGSAKARRL